MKPMPVSMRALVALSCAITVAGCAAGGGGKGDFRSSLGLSAPPPDEFLIVARAPLQTPADLSALPPPAPGSASRVEVDAAATAQAALSGAGGTRKAAAAPTAAEQSLVRATGAAGADPAIRDTLTAEARPAQRRFGLDSLFGFPIQQDPQAAADQLDPAVEAERLRAQGLRAPVAPPTPETGR